MLAFRPALARAQKVELAESFGQALGDLTMGESTATCIIASRCHMMRELFDLRDLKCAALNCLTRLGFAAGTDWHVGREIFKLHRRRQLRTPA